MKLLRFEDLIVYEDKDYILINKPPHVSTLNERTADRTSIIQLARNYCPQAQVCHRLDKETSGILVIAKNPEAYRHVAVQFEKRQVKKIYHAVVEGIHNFEGVDVHLPIKQTSGGGVRIDKEEGKEAKTIFYTKEVFRRHTLVECHPLTGRMHQIRIHLACLKAPIVSDELYGGRMLYLSELKRNFNLKKFTEEQPLIKRVALHAFALAFKALSGEPLYVEAPYPKDIAALLRQLRANM
ncbi:MAG: pseudouridine synthase [Cytophagales bacterium]|nr:pseudouridine synthase [Bernardetiaceae bacterium]MDW8209869.1 pseudouridine synthase [Cytophagales bacterium]